MWSIVDSLLQHVVTFWRIVLIMGRVRVPEIMKNGPDKTVNSSAITVMVGKILAFSPFNSNVGKHITLARHESTQDLCT